MLTSDLVRARVAGRSIAPMLIDVARPVFRDTADALVELVTKGATERVTRGEIDEGIARIVADRREHKVLRGLAKLALDRCTFEVDAPTEPAALRAEVFRAAREVGPLALAPGPLERPTAHDVIATVAARHGWTPEQVAVGLYADLKDQQRLLDARVPDGPWLLDRYNVALAQALLLKATEVRVVLHGPTAPRMKQLFRWVKFHQLSHRAQRDADRLTVVLDGPLSLFRQSTRYGMQLARFLPAMLLQDGAWRLEATVLWTKARHRKDLVLTHEDGLVSHYADTGAWRSRAQQYFAERFTEHDGPWTLRDGTVPIQLGSTDLVFPDYTITDGAREAHLEIVGFWRAEVLAARIAALQAHGPTNLILAVSSKLRGGAEALDGFEGEVIRFAEVLSPTKVIAALERCAREPAS